MKVQFATVTTPATAVRPVQPVKVPPEGVKEMVAVELVTTLPPLSSTVTIGCVKNTLPDPPATGWTVNTSLEAPPTAVGEMKLETAEVKVPKAAVKV